MNSLDSLIDSLNSHRQETIDRLQSRWQDATFKIMLGFMVGTLFHQQNQGYIFWSLCGITTLINILISIYLKRVFPKITGIGIAGEDFTVTGVAGEEIKRGTPVYQGEDGKWHPAFDPIKPDGVIE